MNSPAIAAAFATAFSATFLAGAAAENPHSFAFALFVGGTTFFALVFIVFLLEGGDE